MFLNRAFLTEGGSHHTVKDQDNDRGGLLSTFLLLLATLRVISAVILPRRATGFSLTLKRLRFYFEENFTVLLRRVCARRK